MRLQYLPKRSAPLWLVQNGDHTLGPVPTRWLLQGIVHGHVPQGCRVREVRSDTWRALDQVREVARMQRRTLRMLAGDHESRGPKRSALALLTKAQTAEEVLLFALAAVARLTHADLGLATRVRDYPRPPTTTCVFGEGNGELLGLPIASRDLSLGAARAGRGFTGPPDTSAVHRSASDRLARVEQPLSSVLMVPIGRGPSLFGMLELGRADHEFRTTDLRAATRLAAIAWRKIERLSHSRFD